jgi:ATP-binding cassette subfamily F protein uup
VFLDRIVTSTLAFEGGGRVQEYVGGYADYLWQRQPVATLDAGVRKNTESAKSTESRPRPERPRRLSYKEQRELEALPERISLLEAEQQRLQQESQSPDFYKADGDHIRAVLARIDAIGPELEALLGRWVELEDVANSTS